MTGPQAEPAATLKVAASVKVNFIILKILVFSLFLVEYQKWKLLNYVFINKCSKPRSDWLKTASKYRVSTDL